MKKTITALAIVLICMAVSLSVKAQDKLHIAGGLFFQKAIKIENVELGVASNKNVFTFAATSYNRDNRQYYGGVKYYRSIPIAKNFEFLLHGSAQVNIENDMSIDNLQWAFVPGAALQVSLSDAIKFQLNSGYPIIERTSGYKSPGLMSGGQLVLRLF